MESAVSLPVALPPSVVVLPDVGQRLDLHKQISQLFPGDRVVIILQGDWPNIVIEGMEPRFAAMIVGQGPNQGKKSRLNALTRDGLIHRAKEIALKWQNDSV